MVYFMRYFAILLVALLLAATPFAGFTYLYSMNGSSSIDSDDAYKFSHPSGILAIGGKLYVSDSGKGALYMLNATVPAAALNGTQLMNGTPRLKVIYSSGTEGYLSDPLHMAYDGGLVYIADGISGNILTYIGQGSQVGKWNTGSNMQTASSMALDSQYLYIADSSKKQLLMYSRGTHSYSSIAVQAGPSDGQLEAPADVEIYDGKFFISDSAKNLVFVYGSNFTFLYSMGRNGIMLGSPRGMQVYNDRLYVADATYSRIVVFSMDGFIVDILNSSTTEGNLSRPEDIAVADGRLYVADTGNRLVKVFSINETGTGDHAVMELISQANQSLENLIALQSTAKTLGIAVGQDTLSSDLASAQSYYGDSAYSAANTLAQKVLDSSSSEAETLRQKIGTSVRQLVKSAQDKAAPYRNATLGNLSSQLSDLDGKISGIQGKLSSQDYPGAASAALELPGEADAFVQAAEGKASQAHALQEQAAKGALSEQISALLSRESALRAKAAAYRQPLDLSSSERLLAAAQDYADAADFGSANSSLSLALAGISAYEQSISQIAAQVDGALANMSLVEFQFNSTISRQSLISPDYSVEKKLMGQAMDMLYQNPPMAMAMAQQAYSSASAKSAESEKISLAIASLITMLLLMAAISLVFFLHLRNRGRAKGGKKNRL